MTATTLELTARQRGRLAERMVPVALELACLVRDEGPDAIGEFLGEVAGGTPLPDQVTALLVVTAAMLPVDRPADDLLSWVTFDELGEPLDRPVQPCGTRAAFHRHERAGEEPCEPCRRARISANTARTALRAARKAEGSIRGKASGGATSAAPVPVPVPAGDALSRALELVRGDCDAAEDGSAA